MSTLAIPAIVDGLDVFEACASIERLAADCNDPTAIAEARARLAGMAEYLARKHEEGRGRIAATDLVLARRIGELLGPPKQGRRSDLTSPDPGEVDLSYQDASRLRTLAAHPEIVDRVAAESTDARPASINRALTEIARAKLIAAEPDRTPADAADEAEAIIDVAVADIDDAVDEAIESRRLPMIVPKPAIADDVPPHPATYPSAIIELFRELIPSGSTVLDPFAGVGTIHDLHGYDGIETWGIELEPEWARAHDRTTCGDSTTAHELFAARLFDVIATSPAYGNRLADAYSASDPEARRSYSIDLGRRVSSNSGAGLHYGRDGRYEELHRQVWSSVVRLLKPGGLFLLNCKDFVRAGVVQPVTGWHIRTLADLGLVAVDLRCLPAAGLPYTSAKPLSEVIVVMRKAS